MQKFTLHLSHCCLLRAFGAAYASPTHSGYVSGDQQQDAPKDCKKNPNDPRCKDGQYQGGYGSIDPQQDQPKDCKKNPTIRAARTASNTTARRPPAIDQAEPAGAAQSLRGCAVFRSRTGATAMNA